MAATLSVRPNRLSAGSSFPLPPVRRLWPVRLRGLAETVQPWRCAIVPPRRTLAARKQGTLVQAGSRADDSAPFEMSVENALKLLGVSDNASFDDILRAKNSIVAACKDDKEAIAQVHFLLSFCTGLVPIRDYFMDVFLWSCVSHKNVLRCCVCLLFCLSFAWLLLEVFQEIFLWVRCES